MMMNTPPLRVICANCGQRAWLSPGDEPVCLECRGELRQMGPFERFVDRWFAPPDMLDSNMHRRHLQLVELLWTANDRGREFYDIVNPKKVSYSSFVKRVNALVCRGLAEGWIVAHIPPSPIPDDAAYSLTFEDPDRFVEEMARLFDA